MRGRSVIALRQRRSFFTPHAVNCRRMRATACPDGHFRHLLEVRFVASEGPGSHGTLCAGDLRTTVKDRKKEIGKGLLAKMLADLGIDRQDF